MKVQNSFNGPLLHYFGCLGVKEGERGEMEKSTSDQVGMEKGEGNTEVDCTGPKEIVSCTECGISLSKTRLRKHRKRFHLEGKPSEERPPSDDEQSTSSRKSTQKSREETWWGVSSRLRIDKVSQHQSGKVGCDKCGKSFSSRDTLRVHNTTIHRGGKMQCKVSGCEATFSRFGRRTDHERMVHGHPKLRCKFEGCSSEFFSSGGRQQHHHTRH